MGVRGLTNRIEDSSGIYRDWSFGGGPLVIDGSNLVNLLYFQSGMNTIELQNCMPTVRNSDNNNIILLLFYYYLYC